MELKTFVSATLISIIEGVKDAQEQAAAHGALVNPGGLTRSTSQVSPDALWNNTDNNYARTISFDVAITAEAGTSTSAKIGVLAGIVGASAGGASDQKEVAVSRVKFEVPVLLPSVQAPDGARLGRPKLDMSRR